MSSTQYNPDSKPEGIDKINIDKLSIDQNNPQEELLHVTNSLIPPPTTDKGEKTDVGTDNQQEGKEYEVQQKIYVGHLRDEESNTSSDYSGFSY